MHFLGNDKRGPWEREDVAAMTLPLELHWYIAVLVLESSIVQGPTDPSLDVQFRLIRAPVTRRPTYDRALALQPEAGRFLPGTPYGQTCVWTFKGLKDLQEIIEDELARELPRRGVRVHRGRRRRGPRRSQGAVHRLLPR